MLGSPISHSKSPRMHLAAYSVLGLDWSYDQVDVTAHDLPRFVESLDASWRGLSLTMPLKYDVVPLLGDLDPIAEVTGAVNTVAFGDAGRMGFNTDVAGITAPVTDAGLASPSRVLVLGAGATAGSAVTAVARQGANEITVAARSVERAATIAQLAHRLDVQVSVIPLPDAATITADLVINTLPGGAADTLHFSAELRSTSVLFDVIYDPWPTAIAVSWADAGGRVIPGIEMLLAQALRQVRVFVGGDPHLPLDREHDVAAAMRASVSPGR